MRQGEGDCKDPAWGHWKNVSEKCCRWNLAVVATAKWTLGKLWWPVRHGRERHMPDGEDSGSEASLEI